MLPKAIVVLAITALLAVVYPAIAHHEIYHFTQWHSHGWVKMGERFPTGVLSPPITYNHLFDSVAYQCGSPAAAKPFNKYNNNL